MPDDTIAAIATPPGKGGIGVVRISGPGLSPMLKALVQMQVVPRRATLATFRDAHGDTIDRGLVFYFPAPASYTGEDVIELHGHGGPVVLSVLLKRCLELGARVAQPGEFTQRAYLNDKLDLAQAEAVADLIDAATAQAARCASRSLSGEFSRRVGDLAQKLMELRLLAEATLDFPDEQLQGLSVAQARSGAEDIRQELARVLAAAQRGSILREGLRVVLMGAPNVGKSSLMNVLAGSELAIVTAIPGTTRDAIHTTIDIDGVAVHLTDTAGIHETHDVIENMGIARAKAAIAAADVILHITDAAAPHTDTQAELPDTSIPVIHVRNKVDLIGTASAPDGLFVSAKTGVGLSALRSAILDAAGWHGGGEGLFLARERHLTALNHASGHIIAAEEHAATLELFAEELRLAQVALEALIGRTTADELLGEIFSRFCIGK